MPDPRKDPVPRRSPVPFGRVRLPFARPALLDPGPSPTFLSGLKGTQMPDDRYIKEIRAVWEDIKASFREKMSETAVDPEEQYKRKSSIEEKAYVMMQGSFSSVRDEEASPEEIRSVFSCGS